MTIIKTLEVAASVQQMNNIDSFIKGKVFPLAVEEASSFSSYINDLASTVISLDGQLTGDALQNSKIRAELAYASAIQRDTYYALSGRKALLQLGLHNMFREAYQTGKTAVDAELSVVT
jgi:hypothetical protein